MKVLVIAAHPDDELLGVGGTIAWHVDRGDDVQTCIVSEGATARYEDEARSSLKSAAIDAARVLGTPPPLFLDYPDQRLDTFPILDVIQRIETVVSTAQPEIVYTHHWGDVNRDHRIVCEAVTVACRPIGPVYPKRVLCFETPSSTEWSVPEPSAAFMPNAFVDVTDQLDRKVAAMACYATELRPHPHPRSLEALRARAAYWGQIVTRPYAEAFVLLRELQANT